MVFDLTADQPMRITKSLKQSRRNRGYIVKFNTDFEQVIANCRHSPRIGQDGTWLNDEMQQAYLKLNELGHAKSVAVYKNDELVGGLYGIDLPESKIFCGESMFSKHRDASKIALWWLVEKLQADGYRYIDGQVQNDHLESLGGITLSRKRFLQQLYNW
jgi:leucyl/phenylalanyl-tRNA--protein transferase